MVKAVIGAEVVVTDKASPTVGNIKKELREANKELIAAQAAFGDYSAEALAAAKKVAQLKDSIAEASETAALFDPGNRMAAFGGAVNAVAGGFAAAQGAAALFGSESQELEKTLVKLQGVMALQQGISGILDSQKDFTRLAAIIKTNVVSAFSTLKGAIISTGIGALVVGLGLLIANFDKVKQVLTNLFPGLAELAKTIGGLIQQFTDFVGITSEAERQLDALTAANKRANEDLEAQISILSALGGKEKEIYDKRKQQIDNDLNVLRQKIKVSGELNEEEAKQFRDLQNKKILLDVQENKRVDDKAKQDADRRKQELKAQQDHAKQVEDQRKAERQRLLDIEKDYDKRLKSLQDENFLNQIKNEFDRQRQKLKFDLFAQEQEIKGLQVSEEKKNALLAELTKKRNFELRVIDDEEKKANAEKEAEAQKAKDEKTAADFAKLTEQVAMVRAADDKRTQEAIALAQLEADARIEKMALIGKAAMMLSDIIGRQTAIGKGLAIAGTIIETYQSAQTLFKQAAAAPITKVFPAYPFIQAGLAIAAGLQRVKAITAVQVPGGGGGVSAPSISTMQAPITPQANTTRIDQQQVNQMGNSTVRAYVVESDVSNSQERIQRIQNAARIE